MNQPQYEYDFNGEPTYVIGVPGIEIEDIIYEWSWEWLALIGQYHADEEL